MNKMKLHEFTNNRSLGFVALAVMVIGKENVEQLIVIWEMCNI